MPSSRTTTQRRAVGAVVAGLLALGTAAVLTTNASAAGKNNVPHDVKLQILALNDFHGNLAPPSGSSGRIGSVTAGGVEYLSTHLDQLRDAAATEGAHSVTVAAGDLIGATPLLSAAFHDEPTIEAMNEIGLEVSSVGNHEFDEGWHELVRMQEGGCLDDGDGALNQNSCPDPSAPFTGADFDYLAANVIEEATGETIFPGTTVREYDGVRVGFIGMTLEGTPDIVTAAGVAGLRFTDEVQTANRAARALQRSGVKSVVVLLHEGGVTNPSTDYNGCPDLSGPIVDINAGLSPIVDAIVSGHTHQGYNCVLPDPDGVPRTVTSASSFGRLVTEIDLTINGKSGDVRRPLTTSSNLIVTRDVATDPALTALIDKYTTFVAPIANEVIGQLDGTTVLSRSADVSGESPLGNLIADAQRADPTLVFEGRPVEVAFMNPGGIRADLIADASGNVTYGAAFTVQPFNNYDVSMDLTGDQILAILQAQWDAQGTRILQVSGLEYSWSASAPIGAKVDPSSVLVNGEPLVGTQVYRVAANSFLADGGDRFPTFRDAQDKLFGGLDIDALALYLTENSPYAPVPTDRIDQTP